MARNIILDRWRNYGFRGMYKGMYLSSIKTIPSVGLTYIVYEHLLDLFGTEMKWFVMTKSKSVKKLSVL